METQNNQEQRIIQPGDYSILERAANMRPIDKPLEFDPESIRARSTHEKLINELREFQNGGMIGSDMARRAADALEAVRPETEKDGPRYEADGCPTEIEVLQKFWRDTFTTSEYSGLIAEGQRRLQNATHLFGQSLKPHKDVQICAMQLEDIVREAIPALLTLQSRLEQQRREFQRIDEVLARRPALDKPTRFENIEFAVNTVARVIDENHRLAKERNRLALQITQEKDLRAVNEKHINELNNLLRSIGWGQGEIDCSATVVEERDALASQLAETAEELRITKKNLEDEREFVNKIGQTLKNYGIMPDETSIAFPLWIEYIASYVTQMNQRPALQEGINKKLSEYADAVEFMDQLKIRPGTPLLSRIEQMRHELITQFSTLQERFRGLEKMREKIVDVCKKYGSGSDFHIPSFIEGLAKQLKYEKEYPTLANVDRFTDEIGTLQAELVQLREDNFFLKSSLDSARLKLGVLTSTTENTCTCNEHETCPTCLYPPMPVVNVHKPVTKCEACDSEAFGIYNTKHGIKRLCSDCSANQTLWNVPVCANTWLKYVVALTNEISSKFSGSTIGVGDGSGNLFVHGSYESIKAIQSIILRAEKIHRKLSKRTECLIKTEKLLDETTQERNELLKSYDLFNECVRRATETWRKSNPFKDHVLPDTAEALVAFFSSHDSLVDRLVLLEAELEQLVDGASDKVVDRVAKDLSKEKTEALKEEYEQWFGQICANMGCDPNSDFFVAAKHARDMRLRLESLGPVIHERRVGGNTWQLASIHPKENERYDLRKIHVLSD